MNNQLKNKYTVTQKCIYYWLLVVALGHCFLGVIFIFVVPTNLFDVYFNDLYTLFSVNSSSNIDKLLRTMLQLLGPTITSWGLLLYLAVYFYRQYGEIKEKIVIVIALLLWYIFDTAISLNNGIVAHFILNTAVFVAIIIPFLFLQSNVSRSK